MAWTLLLVAGLLEIVWAFTMKQSQGFTRTGASIVTLLATLASFGLLSASMRTLPLGTAYGLDGKAQSEPSSLALSFSVNRSMPRGFSRPCSSSPV